MLLDPTDPEDWKLLTFSVDGRVTAARSCGTVDYCRAIVSIEVYHLHSKHLVDERRSVAINVERIVGELQSLRLALEDDDEGYTYGKYKGKLQELFRTIAWHTTYSAAALCYARGLIYTVKAGQQIKREWLEQILNERP